MKLRPAACRLPLLVVLLLVWEVGARAGFINANWFTPPSAIGRRFVHELISGSLLYNTWATFFETMLGFAVGVIGGIVFGITLAYMHRLRAILMPYLVAIYGIPRPALAPLFVIWFGIGIVSKILLIASLVYFVVLLYVLDGLRQVSPQLLHMASAVGASKRQVLFKITIPFLLPWISASMKLGISLAIIGAVVGEIVASESGLGHYILQASYRVDTEGVYVGLTALAVMSWFLVFSLARLDRRLFRWRREIEF